MPRYFFDIDDGDDRVWDDVGTELKGVVEARAKAISTLPDVAREKLPDGDRRVFACMVRDESNRLIYKATLTLKGDWL